VSCTSEKKLNFISIEELINYTNTSDFEKSRPIDLFILNNVIVSKDSIVHLLTKFKENKITLVKSVVSSQGNQFDGITHRNIIIQSCVLK